MLHVAERQRTRRFYSSALVAGLLLALSACSPISIEHLSLTDAYRSRNASALAGAKLNNTTHIVLQRQNLLKMWENEPAAAIAALRADTQARFYAPDQQDQIFALAELSYLRARKTRDRAQFMAAALYAYAYLQPDAPVEDQPSPYDIHFRQACDIYMLALTEAMGAPANVGTQSWKLPFGQLDLTANPQDLAWHGHTLTDFRPTARLAVHGVNNIYSNPGLGEPMAAIPKMSGGETSSFKIVDTQTVPVNLLVELPDSRQQVLSDHLSGRIVITGIDEPSSLSGHAAHLPLQFDPTTARAISLDNSTIWRDEYLGFLDGNMFDGDHQWQLAAIEPHHRGRMPVVLIHGTASSPARWADMVNDLLSDPEIRNHFEFWFFSYATGNPIPYSAMQLRRSLENAIRNMGGVQADPALGHITLIGHSQGGLLAKMLVIDAGDRLWNGLISTPLNRLTLSNDARNLLQATLFPSAMPEVQRAVFISTPQHGSYVAALSISRLVSRMVTFPLSVTNVMQQVLAGSGGSLKMDMSPWRIGSVYGMSPKSSFIRSLAAIPVVPDVHAHSIIPVLGNGPLATSDDGVVKYTSAHIPGVESELVVRPSGHSTQSNPITIAEVRRILLEQIEANGELVPGDGNTEQTSIVRMGGEYVPATPVAQ